MRIAALIPHHGPVPARFAECLANLMAETSRTMVREHLTLIRPEIRAMFEEDGSIERKRQRLVWRARTWGADYVLFIDSDQTFPGNGALRLLARERPVIGCNYLTRHGGLNTAIGAGFEKMATRADGGVEEVAALGLGFCLIHTHIFELLGERILFESSFSPEGEPMLGEDVHFFNLVRAAGVGVFLDHELSREIGHIAHVVRMSGEAADAELSGPGCD